MPMYSMGLVTPGMSASSSRSTDAGDLGNTWTDVADGDVRTEHS